MICILVTGGGKFRFVPFDTIRVVINVLLDDTGGRYARCNCDSHHHFNGLLKVYYVIIYLKHNHVI